MLPRRTGRLLLFISEGACRRSTAREASVGMRRHKPRQRRDRRYLLPRVMAEQFERRILLAAGTDDATSHAIETFNTSPAVFVENAGQWSDPAVRFVHQGNGANIALTDTGASFELFRDVPNMGPFESADDAN